MYASKYTNHSKDVPDDYSSDPSVAVDIRKTSDVKFYFISLAVTLLTMIICKIVWSVFKSLSWKLVQYIDDIDTLMVINRSRSRQIKQQEKDKIKTSKEPVALHSSRKLKIRRSVSSNASLRTISLNDSDDHERDRLSKIEKGRTDSNSTLSIDSSSSSNSPK